MQLPWQDTNVIDVVSTCAAFTAIINNINIRSKVQRVVMQGVQ